MGSKSDRVPLLINQEANDELIVPEKKKGELAVILLMVAVVVFGSLNTVARKVILEDLLNLSKSNLN